MPAPVTHTQTPGRVGWGDAHVPRQSTGDPGVRSCLLRRLRGRQVLAPSREPCIEFLAPGCGSRPCPALPRGSLWGGNQQRGALSHCLSPKR